MNQGTLYGRARRRTKRKMGELSPSEPLEIGAQLILATAYGGIWNADQVIRPLRFSGTVSRSQKRMLPRNAFIRSHLMDPNWTGI